jgi:hypothetical protein
MGQREELPETREVVGMSRAVQLLLVVLASCGGEQGAQQRARFVPTPFPADDPRLRFEAEQLDAAQRVASPERFKQMFDAADARLQGRLSADYDTIAGAWCVLYVGDWLALRAARFGERQDWESAIEHYQTLEQTLGRWPEGTEEYRIVGAARAARKRIEARPPLADQRR